MSRAVRRFVLWLLIVILPGQGYAAVTMVACGPTHERMVASARSHVDQHGGGLRPGGRDHGVHDHGVHDHRGHDHGDPASLASIPMTADESAPAVGDLGGYSCSACAACCVSAALPAGDVCLGLPAPAPDMPRPSPAVPLAAVTLDGLERPPRSGSPD